MLLGDLPWKDELNKKGAAVKKRKKHQLPIFIYKEKKADICIFKSMQIKCDTIFRGKKIRKI